MASRLCAQLRAVSRGTAAWQRQSLWCTVPQAPPHFVAPLHVGRTAWEGYSPAGQATPAQLERKKVVNSLLYRAKQRGFLELDIIVGGWAEAHLQRLSDEELGAFAQVLDAENPDLFKWLTGQAEPPAGLAGNPVAVQLKAHVAQHLTQHARQETRGKLGAPWVRGWADSGFPSSGNQQ